MTQGFDYGIYFNGKHSKDFGIYPTNEKVVGFPSKEKVEIKVPYANHIVDLSGIYGGQVFSERTFKQVFFIGQSDRLKEDLYIKWTKIVNWLMTPTGKIKLYDDVMHNYYYLAEVVKEPSLQEIVNFGKLTIEWNCYPFRIYELPEGNDIWDTFDFEMDISQMVDYTVSGTRQISLYNICISTIMPTVVTTAPITISDGAKQHPLAKGTHENVFNLPPGVTKLTLTGNAKVTFDWHKEMI